MQLLTVERTKRGATATLSSMKKGEQPKYVEFGRRVSIGLDESGLTWAEQAKMIGCTQEMLRRYRGGFDMPRDKNMKKLADLIGTTPSELRYGKGPTVPGVIAMQAFDLSPDEQKLLQAYRDLSPEGRKVLRARAVQLLQSFGAPSARNPWGEGTHTN